MKKLITGLLIVLIAMAGFNLYAESLKTPMNEATMMKLINEQRELKGVAPLEYDPTLDRATEIRAEGLCEVEVSHDNFIPELEASGYEYTEAGENLSEGAYGSEATVEAWIESTDHYKTMVDPIYTDTGLTIVDCGDKTVVVHWLGKK